jgi:hypothetical protein
VVILGRIEFQIRLDLGNDGGIVDVRLVELGDIGLGDTRLLGAGREDRRAILDAVVRTLAVELGRIMGDREINLEDAPVADLVGVEADPDRLGVAGTLFST